MPRVPLPGRLAPAARSPVGPGDPPSRPRDGERRTLPAGRRALKPRLRATLSALLAAIATAAALRVAGIEGRAALRTRSGLESLREGRLLSAGADLRRSIEIRPGDPRTLAALGETTRLLALRDPDRQGAWRERALECFAAAIAASPSDARPWLHLARLLAEAGDDPGALEAFNACLARDPLDAEALEGRGDCLERLGRPGQALGDWGRAWKSLREGERERAASRLVGKARRAVPDPGELRALWETHGFDAWRAGLYLERLGEGRAAQMAVSRAAEESPADLDRVEALARLAARNGDRGVAEQALRRLARERGTPGDRERLALFLKDGGLTAEAGAILEALCENREASAAAWGARVSLLRDEGNLRAAEEAARQGIAAWPEDPALRRLLDAIQLESWREHQAEVERRYGPASGEGPAGPPPARSGGRHGPAPVP